MNIPLNCPNCGHENNLNSNNAKETTSIVCKKCNKCFDTHFTEKDLTHFINLSNSSENIMGNIKINL